MTRDLASLRAKDAAIAGGKAVALGELIQKGMPVPPGFVVTTEAFEQSPKGEIPADVQEEILAAFDDLGAEFVAVRSSATVEDAAGASWAGQFETKLNVTRGDLLVQIKNCWASISSPRADAYRSTMKSSTPLSMAVLIQKMIPAEISGVTFTVHPVTGDSNHLVIEATKGLGERLVSGTVTPDAFVVDKRDGQMISSSGQTLSPQQIKELFVFCERIERDAGFACDIEWAFADNKFFILQNRPITAYGHPRH